MSKSILSNEKRCWVCGKITNIEKHHIFGGGCRKLSEKYGIWIYLCHEHHNEPPDGAHHNAEIMERFRKMGQKAAMKKYNWNEEDFIKIFGRNYL